MNSAGLRRLRRTVARFHSGGSLASLPFSSASAMACSSVAAAPWSHRAVQPALATVCRNRASVRSCSGRARTSQVRHIHSPRTVAASAAPPRYAARSTWLLPNAAMARPSRHRTAANRTQPSPRSTATASLKHARACAYRPSWLAATPRPTSASSVSIRSPVWRLQASAACHRLRQQHGCRGRGAGEQQDAHQHTERAHQRKRSTDASACRGVARRKTGESGASRPSFGPSHRPSPAAI